MEPKSAAPLRRTFLCSVMEIVRLILERSLARVGRRTDAAAREQGVHHMRLKSALEEAGIGPAFDPATVHATFHDRIALSTIRTSARPKRTWDHESCMTP